MRERGLRGMVRRRASSMEGTGHEEGYAVRWSGYRQEAHRRCGGGAVAGRRGALLGQDHQWRAVGRSADPEAGPGRAAAGGVLRGGAVRLWDLPAAFWDG